MYEPEYGPATDWRTGEVLIPIREGEYVADVEKPRPVVRCGNCGNHPVRGVSNPACDRPIHKREAPDGAV